MQEPASTQLKRKDNTMARALCMTAFDSESWLAVSEVNEFARNRIGNTMTNKFFAAALFSQFVAQKEVM